jgi:UDP-2,4-diacetamido-2,4,6-trideoxy-beta-L-altropyranose hydrolase
MWQDRRIAWYILRAFKLCFSPRGPSFGPEPPYLPGNLSERAKQEGLEIRMLPCYDENSSFPREENAALSASEIALKAVLLIVDHYQIDNRWEQVLRKSVDKLFVIDDLANRKHDCDFFLDQGYFPATSARYAGLFDGQPVCFWGPRFALLVPSFAENRKKLNRDFEQTRRVLLFFGASDRTASAIPLLETLDPLKAKDLVIDLILGMSAPNRPQIIAAASKVPNIVPHENVRDMAPLFAQAYAYIGPGGPISRERCCMVAPSIVSAAVAANKEPSCAALAEAGAILYLGRAEGVSKENWKNAISFLLATPSLRHALSKASSAITAGLGAARIAKAMSDGKPVLRAVAPKESDLIFSWRNHPATRARFIDPGPFDFNAHKNWPYAAYLTADVLKDNNSKSAFERAGFREYSTNYRFSLGKI